MRQFKQHELSHILLVYANNIQHDADFFCDTNLDIVIFKQYNSNTFQFEYKHFKLSDILEAFAFQNGYPDRRILIDTFKDTVIFFWEDYTETTLQ